MSRIAVTGGLACGKSLAGGCMAEDGIVEVCDADDIAHAVMEPGQPAHGEIVAAFGVGVLGRDGRIDRRTLGADVFADVERRRRLESIVHPRVWLGIRRWLAARSEGCRCAVVVVPLLYETGMDGAGWDAVVCVAAHARLQRERLRARGLTDAESESRLRAQWDVWEKARRADFVILNNGTLAMLAGQVARVMNAILEM